MNKGHIVLVGGEIASHRQIGKGLIHDDNDIRALHALRIFHGCRKPCGILSCLCILTAGLLRRISWRLLHIHILQFHQERHDIAISFVHDGRGKQLIIQTKASHKALTLYHTGITVDQYNAKQYECRSFRHSRRSLHMKTALDQQQYQESYNDQHRAALQCIVKIPCHTGSRTDGINIPGHNRCWPEIQHIIIRQTRRHEKCCLQHQSCPDIFNDSE